MVVLLGWHIPQAIDDLLDEKLIGGGIYMAAISTALIPICYFGISNQPELSPTLSEEEKRNQEMPAYK